MWYFGDPAPVLWIKILILAGVLMVVWFIGFLIKRYIKKVSERVGSEVNNGLSLAISIGQTLIIIVLTTIIFEIDSIAILGMSALFGTGIGFAMSVVIGNTVAGFYLIAVRPFGIGDLIQVKGTEGIVMEIGLNYSKLLALDESIIIIPNKSLLDANLINCSIQIKDLEEQASKGFEIGFQTLKKDIIDIQKKSKKLKDEMLDELMGGKEIVRFPFTVQLKLNIISPDIPLATVNKRMKKLNARWDKKLGYQPRYFFGKYIFRQDMRVIIVVDNPHEILDVKPQYLEDLYVTVFEELQEVKVKPKPKTVGGNK